MNEERFVVDELFPTECVWDNEEKEQLFPDEVAKLLNKQEERIQELEGITQRLNRFNDKLIQENTQQCKNCELAKIQHEQIQELKQQLSKIPDSVKKNWI